MTWDYDHIRQKMKKKSRFNLRYSKKCKLKNFALDNTDSQICLKVFQIMMHRNLTWQLLIIWKLFSDTEFWHFGKSPYNVTRFE